MSSNVRNYLTYLYIIQNALQFLLVIDKPVIDHKLFINGVITLIRNFKIMSTAEKYRHMHFVS